MINIDMIDRPRTHVDQGVLPTIAFAKCYVGGALAASTRALVPSVAAALTAVPAIEAGMRGTSARDAGTKQGYPPRGNPR